MTFSRAIPVVEAAPGPSVGRYDNYEDASQIAHWPILPGRMGVSAHAAGDAGGGKAAIAQRPRGALG
ncbi:hypothetical protein C4K09_3503 [Pseudomonas chlororaphis subsp. aureofaciens]|nr:hypothetical protein C4K09_3503 [Pseudomonas chlororaphis subsp. aureofaciens]